MALLFRWRGAMCAPSGAARPERGCLGDRFEFVPGVRLSARAENDAERFPLIVDGPGRLDGRLVFGESNDEAAPVRGRLGGRRVRATLRIRSRVFDLPDEGGDGGGGGGDVRTALAPRAGRG